MRLLTSSILPAKRGEFATWTRSGEPISRIMVSSMLLELPFKDIDATASNGNGTTLLVLDNLISPFTSTSSVSSLADAPLGDSTEAPLCASLYCSCCG